MESRIPMPFSLLPVAAVMLALAGCGGASEPAPAQPVGRNAPSQEADMRLDEMRIEARLVRAADLGEAMAARYGLPRDDDAWLLLISPRDSEGDGVALDGLKIEAEAGSLIDAPAVIELQRIESNGLQDFVGVIRARAPATLRIAIEARRNGARASMGFTRELPRR